MDYEALAREGALQVRVYVPGKPIEEVQRERGLADVIKLASNENPLPPSPAVIEALTRAISELNRYPDDSVYRLQRALARHHSLPENRIFIGNGSVEILYFLANIFVKPGETIVYPTPSFVVYQIVAQLSLGQGIAVPSDADFEHDLEAMLAAVDERTKLVFVCNPNNPTGTWISAARLRSFVERLPRRVICVLDEAYYEYADAPDYPETQPWLEEFPNLVLLRTYSKIHSLAGLRVGYSLGHPGLTALLHRARPPFNVNSLSQVAAVAALGDAERVARIAAENSLERGRVTAGLRELGCRVLPSQTNFVMAFLPLEARVAYERLLDRGVIVRPMGSFGTSLNAVRISVGLPAENDRMLAAVMALLEEQTRGRQ